MRDSADVIALHQTPFSGKSPKRTTNADTRPREYLTEDEVDRLMRAARSVGRHGLRDATLILLAYRHGLRVSELVALKWSQIDLKQGHLAVVRAKNGTDSTHISCVGPRFALSGVSNGSMGIHRMSSSPCAKGLCRVPQSGN